jgi:hypothetical protein
MAIYDIFELEKSPSEQDFAQTANAAKEEEPPLPPIQSRYRDRFFSSLTARFFFLILLIADALWALYSLGFFILTAAATLLTFCKVPYLLAINARRFLSLKRSLICGISLFIALFSPSFGIMIACTYFLMHDKSGIEEVIPASLQSQFKEFFKSS